MSRKFAARPLRIVVAALCAAVFAAGALAIGVAAAPAGAASTSLTGEVLQNTLTPARSQGECNLEGPSTFSYSVSGPATGPYVGTFTETGSLTFTPSGPSGTPDIAIGPVNAFSAEFTIKDAGGATVVRGSKTLSASEYAVATCALNPQYGTNGQLTVTFTDYSAQIFDPVTGQPSGTDQGRSDVQFNYANNEQEPCFDCVGAQFFEGYESQEFTPVTTSTTTAPTTTSTTVRPTTTTTAPCKPGNGYGDKNHVHCKDNKGQVK